MAALKFRLQYFENCHVLTTSNQYSFGYKQAGRHITC